MIINNKTDKQQLINLFTSFILEKGIEVVDGKTGNKTFFPGIEINNGRLTIDREQLLYPGDLLHEAGHIAVASPEQRATLNNNVTENRPGSEGEEMSVMLWTYAASLQLNVPAEIVFHADGYKGESQWIIEQYRNGNYIGLPLLVWMGLAKNSGEPDGFPKMIKWIRE